MGKAIYEDMARAAADKAAGQGVDDPEHDVIDAKYESR